MMTSAWHPCVAIASQHQPRARNNTASLDQPQTFQHVLQAVFTTLVTTFLCLDLPVVFCIAPVRHFSDMPMSARCLDVGPACRCRPDMSMSVRHMSVVSTLRTWCRRQGCGDRCWARTPRTGLSCGTLGRTPAWRRACYRRTRRRSAACGARSPAPPSASA